MTDSKQKEKSKDSVSSVDVKTELDEDGKIMYTVSTPKAIADFVISKTEDGFNRYQVIFGNQAILGWFTTPDVALEFLLDHIRKMKMTKSRKRDLYYEENKARREKERGSSIQSDG